MLYAVALFGIVLRNSYVALFGTVSVLALVGCFRYLFFVGGCFLFSGLPFLNPAEKPVVFPLLAFVVALVVGKKFRFVFCPFRNSFGRNVVRRLFRCEFFQLLQVAKDNFAALGVNESVIRKAADCSPRNFAHGVG